MKKLIAVFLCLALCLSVAMMLSACGGETGNDETKGNTTADTTPETNAPTAAPTEDDETDAPTDTPTEDNETNAPTEDDGNDTADGGDDTADEGGDTNYDPETHVVISNAEDLMAFNKAVNEEEGDFYEMTVVFTDDIDMTGYTWTPLDSWGLDGVTFDGQGHTISNLVFATHDPEQGTPASDMGSGFVGVNLGNLTFKNLTIKDASVVAYERAVGAFVGLNYAEGCFVSFDNCHVDGFKAEGWVDYNNQDRNNEGHPISFRLAGFVGHNMVGYCEFANSSAKDLELSGFHNLAAFIGYDCGTTDEFSFENCSVEDCKFIFSYCLADSYTIDQPRKFVSVFYNASNWGDNIDFVAESGNTYSGVVFCDWSDDNHEYYPEDFRSWTREEAAA